MLRASVSLFNELATKKINYAHGFFFDCGFQEDNAME
jgi:hypothetical protein